ncbi:PF07588 family protein [Leptospira borgpetersenii serovar Pomona str. 200901868]|uniref:PF07588 family protein n=1 Tax=Leptospira borgpetersenii serovar Pomona str. 200901868 TaxID=1192866 RepID=M6WQQ2_LEPBO|nr:PF07588 family protein [Leptospira borgpetersenii serovar Pomona str. 200901868]
MFQKFFLSLLIGSFVLTLCSCEDKKEDSTKTLFFLLSASGVLGSSNTSTPPTPTSCKNEAFCRTFIATNNGAGYNGNLGGISGADAKCTAAKSSTLKGTYKALLTDQQTRFVVSAGDGSSSLRDWVLYPNKQYRRSDGTTVTFTTNANSMVTGNLENGIDSGAKKYFWTGLAHPDDPGFFLWEGGRTCNQWGDANGAATGAAGNTTSTNAHSTPEGAFTVDTHNCNSNLNLLCVEQ